MRQRVPAAPSSYRRADQPTGDGVGLTNRLGETDRLCETLSSWRLLVGGLSPAASHHSFITSSEEPPLSNFNSYRDIPLFVGLVAEYPIEEIVDGFAFVALRRLPYLLKDRDRR